MTPLMLSAKRAARYLGIPVATFHQWRKDGKEPALPEAVKVRGRTFYVTSELDQFVESCKSLRGRPAA